MSLVDISRIIDNVVLISRKILSFSALFKRLCDAEALIRRHDDALSLSAFIEDCLKDIRLKCGRAESIDLCGEWSDHSFS